MHVWAKWVVAPGTLKVSFHFCWPPKSKHPHKQHSQSPKSVPVFPKAEENPWLQAVPWKNRFLLIPQDGRAPDLTDQRMRWKGVRA